MDMVAERRAVIARSHIRGYGGIPRVGMDARPGKSRSGAAGSAQLAYGVRGYPPCPGWVPPMAIPPLDPL